MIGLNNIPTITITINIIFYILLYLDFNLLFYLLFLIMSKTVIKYCTHCQNLLKILNKTVLKRTDILQFLRPQIDSERKDPK